MAEKLYKHGFIDEDFYKKSLEYLPILTIDLILQNKLGEFLLVKRSNHPLKGEFWTPGGRVHKGETLQHAAVRKCKEETGLDTQLLNWNFIGLFEGNFRKSHFDLNCSTHTVSIVYHHQLNIDDNVVIDNQSSDYKFSKSLPEKFIRLFQNSLITQNS